MCLDGWGCLLAYCDAGIRPRRSQTSLPWLSPPMWSAGIGILGDRRVDGIPLHAINPSLPAAGAIHVNGVLVAYGLDFVKRCPAKPTLSRHPHHRLLSTALSAIGCTSSRSPRSLPRRPIGCFLVECVCRPDLTCRPSPDSGISSRRAQASKQPPDGRSLEVCVESLATASGPSTARSAYQPRLRDRHV